MADGLHFRKDLFRGTSEYYDRFRPPYPGELIRHLIGHVPLDSTSRVLDLACGTGQITFALADTVGEVWAVDQEAEAVDVGRQKAEGLAVTNVTWIAASAEDVSLEDGLNLVAIGNAFHRLDRELVARRLVPSLVPRGCVALLWGSLPWQGARPWQQALGEAFERWTDAAGARDRVPAGWEQAIARPPPLTLCSA
jgi:SAM-dependent methyltransferase